MFKTEISRRKLKYFTGLLLAGFLSIHAFATTLKEIPAAKSLQTEIASAVKTGSPLVVFVSLDNCPFCKIARDNYLLPILNEQSVQVVQVNFQYLATVVDSRGNSVTQDQLVRSLGVKVAPTVLFLGQDGKELAPRLVGGSTSEFYGTYLDERIRTAQAAIKSKPVLK